jgi:PAS domain S-box-containing protein
MVANPSRPAPLRREVAPALFRLLAEASLSRAALDACGLPVALVDAVEGGRSLTYVNQAFESFFGYRAAEALGRSAAALPFTDAAAAEGLFREGAAPIVLRAQRKDGSQVHVEASSGAVRGGDGRVTHWVLAFSDRTELEKLRERLFALGAAATGV